MGEFESRIKYAKSVGADVSRLQLDRRTTSQRITDEMNEMRLKLKTASLAYENLVKDWAVLKKEVKWYRHWLKQIDMDGPVTGEDAEDMRRWASLALEQFPTEA